jgi:hypothetical protein
MTSHGGFVWPESGPVECPDWEPVDECGNGLHGLLWGVGDAELLNWSPDAKWLVVSVEASTLVDLCGKVKFPRGEVVHCGDVKSATEYIRANGGDGKPIVGITSTSGDWGTSISGYKGTSTSGKWGTSISGYGGTSTSGDWGTSISGYNGTSTSGDWGTSTSGGCGSSTSGYGGTSTSGDWGTSTSGDWGTSTSGNWGTSISGYRGTSISGYGGVAAAGSGGIVVIRYRDGDRYGVCVGRVKDDGGEGELEPYTKYRLNDQGEFVEADGA